MTDKEIDKFIAHMKPIGDIWEKEDVRRVYGDQTLEDAIESREKDMGLFAHGINTLLNSLSSEEKLGKDE